MSSPELQEIYIPQLIPIQSIIDPDKLRKFIGPLLPIDVMPYEGNGDRARYLLLDGHHRAYREFELGRETVWTFVYSRDEQLEASQAPLTEVLKSMDAIREWFHGKKCSSSNSVPELLFNIWD